MEEKKNQSEKQGVDNQLEREESDQAVNNEIPPEKEKVTPVMSPDKMWERRFKSLMIEVLLCLETKLCRRTQPTSDFPSHSGKCTVIRPPVAQVGVSDQPTEQEILSPMLVQYQSGLESIVSTRIKNLEEIASRHDMSGKEVEKKRKTAPRSTPDTFSFIDMALSSGIPLLNIGEGAVVGTLALLNKAIVKVEGIVVPDTVPSVIATSDPVNSLVRVNGSVGNFVFFNSEPVDIYNKVVARGGWPPARSSTRVPLSPAEMSLLSRGPLLHVAENAKIGNLVICNEVVVGSV